MKGISCGSGWILLTCRQMGAGQIKLTHIVFTWLQHSAPAQSGFEQDQMLITKYRDSNSLRSDRSEFLKDCTVLGRIFTGENKIGLIRVH